tara:strand:- start:20 stop:505 length:486 start_codon:yes stop_codon:yes gene_type:complete
MKTITSEFFSSDFLPSIEPKYIHPVNGNDIHDDALGLGMHFYQHMIAGHNWSHRKKGIKNLAELLPTQIFLLIADYHFALKEGWIERDDSSKRKAKRVLDKWIKLNPHWIENLKAIAIDEDSIRDFLKHFDSDGFEFINRMEIEEEAKRWNNNRASELYDR